MKVLFVIVGVLCLAFLTSAEPCGDGGYCTGVGRCCRTATSYKCAPVDNVVCCPGGDYSCPNGDSCVKILWWFICVKLGTPTRDGSFELDALTKAITNDKCYE
ncbi:uncharacterized protein [Parasteatoda tepidariorum]|uniref:uncharacterized protein isoform X2 n=1 Tax=Parasteatoda tepidariorum TaxID=114398 RepID=UPI00077FA098|nr:uncharacterized protein LOC107453859 isoform X2 [Parasteatoda tepidariorum]